MTGYDDLIRVAVVVWQHLASRNNTLFTLFSVFTSHVIKTETRNHSLEKVKNLRYDRWLTINNLAKNQVFAVFQSRVICRSVLPKFIELCMETPCLCPSELAKTKAITLLLTYATAFLGRHFQVKQRKSLEIQMCCITKGKNPVKLKRCEISSSYRVFNLMQLKPQKEK